MQSKKTQKLGGPTRTWLVPPDAMSILNNAPPVITLVKIQHELIGIPNSQSLPLIHTPSPITSTRPAFTLCGPKNGMRDLNSTNHGCALKSAKRLENDTRLARSASRYMVLVFRVISAGDDIRMHLIHKSTSLTLPLRTAVRTVRRTCHVSFIAASAQLVLSTRSYSA